MILNLYHRAERHNEWLRPLLHLSPMYVWFAIFFSQAHKEVRAVPRRTVGAVRARLTHAAGVQERFLYTVYPAICLNAAIGLRAARQIALRCWHWARWPGGRVAVSVAVAGTLLLYALLGLSRMAALYRYYGAPMQAYAFLGMSVPGTSHNVTVCVGKEWHRFPSSFFLPHSRYGVAEARMLAYEHRGLTDPLCPTASHRAACAWHLLRASFAASYPGRSATATMHCNAYCPPSMTATPRSEIAMWGAGVRWPAGAHGARHVRQLTRAPARLTWTPATTWSISTLGARRHGSRDSRPIATGW